MKRYVDTAIQSFPNISHVVLTGGECFLLGDDLADIIQYIHSKKLSSRVVTNGYWASSKESAKKILSGLKALGLSEEILVQEFVHIEKVINGIIASLELYLTTVVNVESGPERAFTSKDLYKQEPLKSYLTENDKNRKLLHVLSGMWMPFTEESLKDLKPFNSEIEKKVVTGRCTNLFSSITISPTDRLLACCGLPMSNIEYLDLGNATLYTIDELYDNQFCDFLKIWLYVDGPYKILKFIADRIGNDNVPELALYSHTCFYCAVLFTNKKYLSFVQTHYKEIFASIMMRYLLLTKKHKNENSK